MLKIQTVLLGIKSKIKLTLLHINPNHGLHSNHY